MTMAATSSAAALPARKPRQDVRGLVFTGLVILYAALILFPVFWMWLLAFKPENVMFDDFGG